MRRWLILLCALTLVLACNFPGFPGTYPALSPTETLEPEGMPGETEDGEGSQANKPTPRPLETPTPEGRVGASTPTMTPTGTAPPTATPTATPTPEAIVPGPPLAFRDPAWELVEWHQIPETSDWEGTLRIHVTGGTAPYRSQLENQEIVSGLEVQARWRMCKAMPATIRVWSADGQVVHSSIWVWELGCSGD